MATISSVSSEADPSEENIATLTADMESLTNRASTVMVKLGLANNSTPLNKSAPLVSEGMDVKAKVGYTRNRNH